MPFQFTPSDGYRNVVSFPTKPANETAFRDSMQTLLDQVATELNSGTNSASGIANMSRQAIINGNMDVWQRGTSFTNPATAYTADRFRPSITNSGTIPNLTHSQLTLVNGELPGSSYAYRIANDGPGTGQGANDVYQMRNVIEYGARYLCGAGRKVTVSFWAKSSIPGKRIGFYLAQNYGSGGTPSAAEDIPGSAFTLTSAWQKLTLTFTTNTLSGKTFGTNNNDRLELYILDMWGSTRGTSVLGGAAAETFGAAGSVDIAQLQICAGDTALPFQPKTFAQELLDCQRYYEKSYDYTTTPGTANQNNAENILSSTAFLLASQNIKCKVRKRVTPTVTIYSAQNGTLGNCSEFNASSAFVADRAVTTNSVGENSFVVVSSSGNFTINSYQRFQWAIDAEI